MAAKARRSPALRRLSPTPTNTPRAASATGIAGSSDSSTRRRQKSEAGRPQRAAKENDQRRRHGAWREGESGVRAEPCRLRVRHFSSAVTWRVVPLVNATNSGRSRGDANACRTCAGVGASVLSTRLITSPATETAPIAGRTGINANDFGADSRQRPQRQAERGRIVCRRRGSRQPARHAGRSSREHR